MPLSPTGDYVGIMRVKGRARKAFTLIEMMIAIFCLAIVTLAILGLLAMSTRVSKQAEARLAAMAIARKQIEDLRSRSQASRLEGSNVSFTIPASILTQYPNTSGMVMRGSYTVSSVAGSDTLQRVTVRVNWGTLTKPTSGTKRSEVVLSTLVALSVDTQKVDGKGTIDELFEPPPPPPPPPPTTTGSTTGSSTGGTTGSTTGTTTGGTTGSTTGSTTGTTGGGTGGSTGGTTGTTTGTTTGGTTGGGGGTTTPLDEFDAYGGIWGLFYPVSTIP